MSLHCLQFILYKAGRFFSANTFSLLILKCLLENHCKSVKMTLHASPFQLFYIFFEYLFAHVARLLFPLEPRAEYNVEGKTAVITGANSGLGKQTADVLAQRGAKVILACRDLDSANTVVHKIRESTGNNNVVRNSTNLHKKLTQYIVPKNLSTSFFN